MAPRNVVLLQSDNRTVQPLIAQLSTFFPSVREARSLGDLREDVAKHKAQVIIVDIESASFREVERLSHDFPGVCIVCNHRLADEQMWTMALNAGAADCCASSDPRSILEAARRHAVRAHRIAA